MAFWRTLAHWHISLGWLLGVPILVSLANGLFVTARPLPQMRSEHLLMKALFGCVLLPSRGVLCGWACMWVHSPGKGNLK